VLDYGLPATLRNGTHCIDCTVVCPHLEAEEHWDADRLARLIDALRQRHERIVLCGFSLGATGACGLISRFGTLPHLTLVVAGRFLEGVGEVRLDRPVVFVEGEHDEWSDTRDFRVALSERRAPFTHVCMPGAGHFIAETSMETDAVTDALAALGITYRRA
jgi:pimeloyl-ACP methyl ester carboxylesterase